MLIPDLDAGCSLADSITADQLRAWKAEHPGALVVMYVNTTAEVKAETDYCVTSSNAVKVVEHIYARARRGHGDPLRPGHVARRATSRRRSGARCTSGTASATCTPASAPSDISAVRAAHPGADFLIHPECGCTTSVMEYVASGDVDAEGVHMLSTGGMLGFAREHAGRDGTAIVATETGMLHPLRKAAPDVDFIAANEAASCRFMKMITLTGAARRAARRRARGARPRRRSPSARAAARSSAWSRSARTTKGGPRGPPSRSSLVLDPYLAILISSKTRPSDVSFSSASRTTAPTTRSAVVHGTLSP